MCFLSLWSCCDCFTKSATVIPTYLLGTIQINDIKYVFRAIIQMVNMNIIVTKILQEFIIYSIYVFGI